MLASDALLRPWTPGLFEITTAISAELDGRLACSISACRLVPGTDKPEDFEELVSRTLAMQFLKVQHFGFCRVTRDDRYRAHARMVNMSPKTAGSA